MKRIFNLVMMFFALAITFLLEPNALQAQPVDTICYLQNTKSETVVLASNSILGGEIYSNQEEDAPNISGGSPFLVSHVSKKADFNKNKALLNKSFIHNLSTDNKKVHPIRAP
jgi:hypothetical protein